MYFLMKENSGAKTYATSESSETLVTPSNFAGGAGMFTMCYVFYDVLLTFLINTHGLFL